jgi:uncharacterized OB-fold protein
MTLETKTHAYLPAGLPAPQPSPDGLDAPYWEATRRHELVVQRCEGCGAAQWEPEWYCTRCGADAMAWEAVAPQGRIFSWERVWTPVHPALKEAVPYLVVLVELPQADGVRMIGNLLGDPHQAVEIGAAVEAVFEDHADRGYALVQWRGAAQA